ncbi:VIT1/CCC1 transporter family protein [Alicyclobacillus dauci]|uniref:VIT1/CCC1 transporter family protein n=1 Tax=Alicyclobacillus dauci TaxID=1475485 RepID=A0ABY6Z9P0_9BACL|nr:VIT1/CCC1 transporter family protein [Alicyclobacillus dauci]WAH39589.1 VIT1/CCC1 transporter family protein [Alicyclobacillus dauci]WAH39590.1 VIT1/CCC1 transporter family protein [Alicyclobacillus dauci]WAH39592.1 VIT1/CCC1 transporter family protein [Alicyclobacillus dauci]WAH39593.1 VIT1/CCC1 transporter family protein [Alicyclobacillus dauci]
MEHAERHFTGSEFIRDIVIGMSDGLTVPFALAAGLSGTVSQTSLVVIAGMSEIAAGCIAMGLGGYLAANTDREHYFSELRREEREIDEVPGREREEVRSLLLQWGVPEENVETTVNAISQNRKNWIDFMMKFELGLEEPDPKRAVRSSITIAISYIVGGIIPLAPYIFIHHANTALVTSVIITLIALFIFGFVKGRFTGVNPFKSAIQTLLVGGIAAAAAFGLAKVFAG